jgi:hypothetical protein
MNPANPLIVQSDLTVLLEVAAPGAAEARTALGAKCLTQAPLLQGHQKPIVTKIQGELRLLRRRHGSLFPPVRTAE